jgi:hypothetical protein
MSNGNKKLNFKKVGLLIGSDTDIEALALRHTLEYFGYEVPIKWISRPNDFVEFLQGKLFSRDINIYLLCLHGTNGKFVMPKLSKDIYTINEPKGNIGSETINMESRLKNKIIISTACSVGNVNVAKSFIKNDSTYIAAKGYVEGNAALIFCQHFFYHLIVNSDINKSFESSRNIDNETMLFKIFS